MANLQANFEAIDDKLTEAYFTLQAARSRIYEGRELTISPKPFSEIAESITHSLDLITNLNEKRYIVKEKALAPVRTNQTLQGEST